MGDSVVEYTLDERDERLHDSNPPRYERPLRPADLLQHNRVESQGNGLG